MRVTLLASERPKKRFSSCANSDPGFISESFNSISAAAGNAAMCHYATTPERNALILPEKPYLLDSGVNTRPAPPTLRAALRSGLGPRVMIALTQPSSKPSMH